MTGRDKISFETSNAGSTARAVPFQGESAVVVLLLVCVCATPAPIPAAWKSSGRAV